MSIDERRWKEIISAEDVLSVVVRGHSALDAMLSDAIAKAIPAAHEVELSRLSFPLKVDLAVATGMLGRECRPSMLGINKLRNQFAHTHDSVFTARQAAELRSTMSEAQRQALEGEIDGKPNPSLILNRILTLLYIELDQRMEAVDDGRLRLEILHEIVEETLADSPVRNKNSPGRKRRDAEIERRLQERKRNR